MLEVVEVIEVVGEVVEASRMKGVELFFLTGKYVAGGLYYLGNSSDKEIFELMIQMVYLELRVCFRLYRIWVSGTKQIAAGIYGF